MMEFKHTITEVKTMETKLFNKEKIEREIAQIFKELRLPITTSGYRYLYSAVEKAVESIYNNDCNITNGVYKKVMEEYNASYSSINRAMIYSIKGMYQRGNKEKLYKLISDSEKNIPPLTFIGMVAQNVYNKLSNNAE